MSGFFFSIPPEILKRAAGIRLAVFDVDGVLTDGKLWFTEDGREIKMFHVHDGLGIKHLLANHIDVAMISARISPAVSRRAAELGIIHIYQGQEHKLACFQQLCHALKIPSHEVCYTGDDLPDLPVMAQVGLSIAVANAHPQVIERAAWQTQNSGGNGAVREVCDLLLFAHNHYQNMVELKYGL